LFSSDLNARLSTGDPSSFATLAALKKPRTPPHPGAAAFSATSPSTRNSLSFDHRLSDSHVHGNLSSPFLCLKVQLKHFDPSPRLVGGGHVVWNLSVVSSFSSRQHPTFPTQHKPSATTTPFLLSTLLPSKVCFQNGKYSVKKSRKGKKYLSTVLQSPDSKLCNDIPEYFLPFLEV
jgi:hypothetical protein